jgi:hypothetical protein
MNPKRTESSNPPLILIIIVGVLLVFGCYALWSGLITYVRQGDAEARASQEAQANATATAAVPPTLAVLPTFPPTWTPPPPCIDFIVTVDSALVRSCPSESCGVVHAYPYGEQVCVIRHMGEDSDWYEVELDTRLRSMELGYMHQNVIAAVNPTPIPSQTNTPMPTVTPAPTNTLPPTRTPAPTYTPTPTHTPDPNAPTPLPTLPYEAA